MGIQRAIAAQIKEQNCDYVFALKKNQADLYEEVLTLFIFGKIRQGLRMFRTTPSPPLEKSHGRIERENLHHCKCFKFISKRKDWKSFRSIVRIESTRELKGNPQDKILYNKR